MASDMTFFKSAAAVPSGRCSAGTATYRNSMYSGQLNTHTGTVCGFGVLPATRTVPVTACNSLLT